MKTRTALLPLALLCLAPVACRKPDTSQRIQVQITSTPGRAILSLGSRTLGEAPRALTLDSPGELLDLKATLDQAAPAEKRIRILSLNQAEVSFVFGLEHSAMARALGLPRILVFDYGAGVTFELDKAELRPAFLPLLQRQATLLQGSFAGLPVYVCGHTDSTGNRDHNQILSVDRARAVADHLAFRGISRERLRIQGFGSDYPVADNETEQGRSLNRRTEVILPQ
nr:OmpA family protein [uncultured Holophaga sp.]